MTTSGQLARDVEAHLRRVRDYWERTHAAYLRRVGTTFQAGRMRVDPSDRPPETASNLHIAARAGVRPGDRLLDAGCGVCGPSGDIARHYEGVTVEALTISPAQVETARERLARAGLSDRVRVSLQDYHRLPFPADQFDGALFLESAGHAYDRRRAFADVLRALRPGGTIYVKDVFLRDGPLAEPERRGLAVMDDAFVYDTTTLATIADELRDVGYEQIRAHPFADDVVDAGFFNRCFHGDGEPTLTEFALHHFRFVVNRHPVPVFWGEVYARKPR